MSRGTFSSGTCKYCLRTISSTIHAITSNLYLINANCPYWSFKFLGAWFLRILLAYSIIVSVLVLISSIIWLSSFHKLSNISCVRTGKFGFKFPSLFKIMLSSIKLIQLFVYCITSSSKAIDANSLHSSLNFGLDLWHF